MKVPMFSRESTRTRKFGRRSALLGLGGAAMAIPFLPSLTKKTEAQTEVRKRFISYRITNGHYGHQWLPSDSQTGALTQTAPNVRQMRMSEIPGDISQLLNGRFDPYRDKMTLFRHLDMMDGVDHNKSNTLFGWSNNDDNIADVDWNRVPPSIDQIMAREVFDDLYSPLNLCVRWSSEGVSASFSVSGGQPVMSPGLYPAQAYRAVFGDLEIDESTADRRRSHQRTIVDRVLTHYQDVRTNPRLSMRDRDALDQHVDHMHTLHRRLSTEAISCTAPGAVSPMDKSPETVNARGATQIDIAVAALRCGAAPIINLYLDPDVHFTNMLHGIEGHHAASHQNDASAVTAIGNAHEWHMNQLHSLIEQLDATVDPAGGTLLDQSLILVSNEIGNQNGATNDVGSIDPNHIGLDVQALLIGSCDGAIQTGNYVDLRTEHERSRWTRYVGTAYNQLLISAMLAMGVTPNAWEVDGPGYGDQRGGPYNKTPPDQVVQAYNRELLPGLA